MSSDEIVWQYIGNNFCSYKLKTTKDQTFCRNEYNVTGLCSRQSCPLANSRYATIRPDPATGALYLCMKTIERAHLPSKWWERVRLPRDYAAALVQVDTRLQFWPKFLVHKCKQRLTRLTQVAIRAKRLAREEERLGERVVAKMAPKVRRREEGRERKAEAAAKVERAIERELVERLVSGAYSDQPLNVDEAVWKKVLRRLESKGEGTRDEDLDEGVEEEEEEEESGVEVEREEELEGGDVEYVSDIEGLSDDEELGDLEDWQGSSDEESGDEDDEEDDGSSASGDADEEDTAALKKALAAAGAKRKNTDVQPSTRPAKKKATGDAKVGIEYEIENEAPAREQLYA